MSEMSGRVALVTGGGNGAGAIIAQLFARRGASVVIGDIDAEAAARTAAGIRDDGGAAIACGTDVGQEEQVRRLVQTAVQTYGRLDHAVNNAGIEGAIAALTEQTEEQLWQVLRVNLAGVFFGLKHQIPVMVQQGGGSIVNISSIAGLRGHPGLAPYVAAKHGVNGLTKTAAIEYGPAAVRVNAVCPGGIRTPQLERYLEAAPHIRAALLEANPLRRFAEPHEIAETAVWLCSDAAAYVNGHELTVDGGKICSSA